ncbi:polyprenyl synthetase family protein [Arsenicicoccus sp. oral taxon 190]|uniref:polyprenyl synthetase family protein n=1 Tax=Arsenicicoccus sp. oral taxon 190 TaxID=1658671 RepID=UPI0009E33A4C|nr:polyprenyl synthetase family protein [Arsenicicoccus sp. oral taxon 190]
MTGSPRPVGVPSAVAPTAALAAIPGATDELMARVAAGLEAVEARIRVEVDHEDPFIAGASAHLLSSGKRFRPILTLLAAELGDGFGPGVETAATAVELTHLASLYHDDVMDEAEMRRAVVSANAAYGNSTAILVGDLLFGTASRLLAELGPEAVRIQAETFVRLCSGQIRDDHPCPPGTDPVAYYLGVLADKTGVLIATAARYGGMFSGCDDVTCQILESYGEKLGIAFQLADDVLDVTSDESGKEPGTDLREGVDTLPVLYVKASTDPADRRLQELLARDLRDDDAAHAEALALLRAHTAVQRARDYTRQVAEEAQQVLEPLGDGDAVQALRALAAGVVDRTV